MNFKISYDVLLIIFYYYLILFLIEIYVFID